MSLMGLVLSLSANRAGKVERPDTDCLGHLGARLCPPVSRPVKQAASFHLAPFEAKILRRIRDMGLQVALTVVALERAEGGGARWGGRPARPANTEYWSRAVSREG